MQVRSIIEILRTEFEDLIYSDPDFNYSGNEFKEWLKNELSNDEKADLVDKDININEIEKKKGNKNV